MSKSHGTTARAARRPRAYVHPQDVIARRVLLKLRPGNPVFAELYEMAEAAPMPEYDDLAAYFRTRDAQRCEWWQALALGHIRRWVGRPLTTAAYRRMRRALVKAGPQLKPAPTK